MCLFFRIANHHSVFEIVENADGAFNHVESSSRGLDLNLQLNFESRRVKRRLLNGEHEWGIQERKLED